MHEKNTNSTLVPAFYQEPLTLSKSDTNHWVDQMMGGFFHHGVTVLLLVMLLFVLLPFLAPVFMVLGWSSLANATYQLYALFCHQLPQRSWFLFGENLTYTLDEIRQVYSYETPWQLRAFIGTPEMGWKVAWSDRMVSFYTMIPIFGLWYLLPRLRLSKPISYRLLLLTLLPLVVDGSTHALNDIFSGISGNGFRDSNAWLSFLTNGAFPGFYGGDDLGTFNWWLRLLTGLMAAWGIAAFLFPWLTKLLREEAKREDGARRQPKYPQTLSET